jgi:F0F1-type ATP synthase assembly protein I
MALDMSWRLAIVVLLPIVGGVKLDEVLGTTPLLALLGIIIGTIGVAYVMWRTYKLAENVEFSELDNQEKN